MAPEFRTRPDGTRYPITPRHGAAGLVAIGIAVALAGGGSAGGLGATAGAGTAVSQNLAGNLAGDVVDGLPGRDLTARRTEARRSAQRGRSVEAWSKLKLKQLARRAEHRIAQKMDCVAASSGAVREFLLHTPPLDTALVLGLTNVRLTALHYRSRIDGKAVVVAEADTATGHLEPATLDAIADVASYLPVS